MIVYHGSNMIVDHPRLVRQNRTLDFGYGFYTTFNKDQAVNFSEKVTARRETGIPCVSMYETAELEELKNKYKLLFFHKQMRNDWISYLQIVMEVMKG